MTEREITPPAEQQRFLLETLEDRLDRRNRVKTNPFLVKVADKGVFETYRDLVFVKIHDSTQPNGFRMVMNLDMARVANDIIKRYKDGFEEAALMPQAPIGSPLKHQSLEKTVSPKGTDERLAKAVLKAVDMVKSLKQPVRFTVDDDTVNYEIGEKVLQENPMEMETEKIVPSKPNEISPAISPMEYDYDWEEDEGWTKEVYPKTDIFGHSS